MIWATVSSWSCFWLYRASPSLAAKHTLTNRHGSAEGGKVDVVGERKREWEEEREEMPQWLSWESKKGWKSDGQRWREWPWREALTFQSSISWDGRAPGCRYCLVSRCGDDSGQKLQPQCFYFLCEIATEVVSRESQGIEKGWYIWEVKRRCQILIWWVGKWAECGGIAGCSDFHLKLTIRLVRTVSLVFVVDVFVVLSICTQLHQCQCRIDTRFDLTRVGVSYTDVRTGS